MRLSIIAAVAENRVIGRDNALPWHLGADLKRFRAITTGHTVILGRRTWESLGRPLPRRRNIVISGNPDFHPEGAEAVVSLDAALERVRGEEEVFVIGGRRLFELSLPRCSRIYLTRVHALAPGEVLFPEWKLEEWKVLREEYTAADANNDHAHTFQILERIAARGDARQAPGSRA